MKIIICSTKDSIRKRWRSMLYEQGHSIYQVSSPQMLQSVVHKDEQYLFLIHQPFFDEQTIASLCRKSDIYKVFVFSDTPHKKEGIVLLQRGAVGYANAYISEARLIEAIKTVQSGRVWFGQDIVNMLIKSVNLVQQEKRSEESVEETRRIDILSERENEIALLVSEGMSNSEIGEKLFISERTVKSHISTIFNKTGAKSRLQLALLILRPSP